MPCCASSDRVPGARVRKTPGAATFDVVDAEAEPCAVLAEGLDAAGAVLLSYAYRDGMVCQ